ncbi:MAG: ATP-binding cassette domain-containing protein, partial [Candidatus Micrarchaeota archaeon]|nr:ATP-binding cassette domain-containing protein [Candidatus Micrarchaeota archaeon]
MQLLELKNLKVFAGEKNIVPGISLEVGKGEVHVIMGQNGSGKSTLLSALAGNPVYRTEGTALFEGKDLLLLKPHQRAREGLFLAFQSPIEIPGVQLGSFLRRAYAARFGKEISVLEFDGLLRERAEKLGMERS